MSDFTALTVVGVDFNIRPGLRDGIEVWQARCAALDAVGAGVLLVGELVLAVTEVPGDGFVARVVTAPYARGRWMNPQTGEGEPAYRVEVTPVDLAPLKPAS